MTIRKVFSAGLRGRWHLLNHSDKQTPGSVQPQALRKEKSQSFFLSALNVPVDNCGVSWE